MLWIGKKDGSVLTPLIIKINHKNKDLIILLKIVIFIILLFHNNCIILDILYKYSFLVPCNACFLNITGIIFIIKG